MLVTSASQSRISGELARLLIRIRCLVGLSLHRVATPVTCAAARQVAGSRRRSRAARSLNDAHRAIVNALVLEHEAEASAVADTFRRAFCQRLVGAVHVLGCVRSGIVQAAPVEIAAHCPLERRCGRGGVGGGDGKGEICSWLSSSWYSLEDCEDDVESLPPIVRTAPLLMRIWPPDSTVTEAISVAIDAATAAEQMRRRIPTMARCRSATPRQRLACSLASRRGT